MREGEGGRGRREKWVRRPFLTPAKAVRLRHEQRVSRGDVGGEICHALMAKSAPLLLFLGKVGGFCKVGG